MRFLCLRLTLWASACVDPHGYHPSPGSVLLLHPGFLFSDLVVWGSFRPVHSPLSSFGMWSPFRVISVLCHYCSPTKVSFGGVFRLGGSLPFRSGVVVSLRPLSVCHGSMWLVPAFFPSLSLSFPVCAHFQLAGIFFCLLTALHPTSGSWYAGSCGFSSPLGLPTLAMGSPLRGRGLLVLDRNEGLVSPFGSGTLVSSWLDIPPLSAGICAPCHSGCVAWWSSLCPYRWVTSPGFFTVPCLGSGVVFRTLPSFLPAGVGASVGCSALRPAAACALFPGVPLSPLCTPGRRSASRFT